MGDELSKQQQRSLDAFQWHRKKVTRAIGDFGDEIERGDATEQDYWTLIREIAEAIPAIEDAAIDTTDFDDTQPHALAVCGAFKAIHHLTYDPTDTEASEKFITAAEVTSNDRPTSEN